ncbi:MAG: ABC transporter permease [Proteobacteria bacterium]|jgi:phospholipid/cholesterol/gamma-HCH transport system permease protein|nr:ABC transporter permease [Pseudomonadota bacterium]
MTQTLLFFGGLAELFTLILKNLKGKLESRLIAEQVFQIGHRSLPLVIITAASTGMVMALQYGLGLERFGGTIYVPRLVTVTILREMGPVFTALMLAARVGAGIASEIGSMMVTQQIDAIRALGTSPIKKIVLPRVLACLISLPLLVGIANLVAFLGGLAIGVTELKLDPQFYVLKAITNLSMMDYFAGFAKSFFFALFIAVPACYYGLNVQDGTKGVGVATTKAVVTSSIFILIGDFFLTKLFWVIEKWT